MYANDHLHHLQQTALQSFFRDKPGGGLLGDGPIGQRETGSALDLPVLAGELFEEATDRPEVEQLSSSKPSIPTRSINEGHGAGASTDLF